MNILQDWNRNIKDTDEKLKTIGGEDVSSVPIRKTSSIVEKKPEKKEAAKSQPAKKDNKKERISSTDYRKWDKYNADVEVLRMELEEEREQESIEIKNRRNQKMYGGGEKPAASEETEEMQQAAFERLNDIEKDKLCEE